MELRHGSAPGPRLMGRVAVVGMLVAVVALGGLALWSARVAQREAKGLTSVGVQMTGQLRALRSLHVIQVETAALEEDYTQEALDRLRAAEKALPAALERMGAGDAPEAVGLAREAEPVAARLVPAVERYLTDPRGDILYRGGDGGDDDTAEEEMEGLIGELELMLNAPGSDPAGVLSSKLDEVEDAGRAVSRTALVLAPVGLSFAIVCGVLLRVYRRRSESALQAALEKTAREARTDQLTGLPNRRGLLEELARRVEEGTEFTIALADLNGFKHYNDTFGHPAGDALLRRLGRKLAAACAGRGFAARLGGDEFCVLTRDLQPDALQQLLHGALGEEGEGFHVTCASGVAVVPAEAADASAALHLADARLYAAKARSRPTLWGRDTAPAGDADGLRFPLARALERRYPDLGHHLDRVTRLAVACAHDLELPAEQIVIIERAAQLYDIGKVALPGAILDKHGGLTADEEEFMRRQSVIGERLLTGIDDLVPVAAIVRATHERWDGDGYPDELSGDDIPVGARIIAAVDAFCAMTSDRDGAPARSVAEALAELDRRAGGQFDPGVVSTVARVVTRGPVPPASPSHAVPRLR